MRPIPLPPDHQIDPADLKAAGRLLRATDTNDILCQRFDVLARVVAFVRSLRLDLHDVLLVECGAHQQDPPVEDDWEYNPALSHFLALHGPELGVDYRAFDPGYAPEILDREFADGLAQESLHRPPLFSRRPEIVPVLAERVKAVSLATYDDVVRTVTETPKPVVLFSNHVLNDPDRTDDLPFWQLPGLHYHSTFLLEMADILSADEEEAPDRPPEEPRHAEDMTAAVLKTIAGKGKPHIERFKQVFGIAADVRRAFGRDLLMRYWWSAA
ncbi:MAG: hypothetical protein KBC95_03025 [Candidatus Peribacteraceae bacterium]|nr:hypothetical protein [Candidatus Peribacteraceae bacterium]